MLFDATRGRRDDFIKKAADRFRDQDRRILVAMEWQPKYDECDQMLFSCLADRGVLGRYVIVGDSYTPQIRDSFHYVDPYLKVACDFPKWGDGKLDMPAGSVDMAYMVDEAVDALGSEELSAALQETARVLRPTGHLALFGYSGKELPEGVEKHFTMRDQLNDQRSGLVAYQLTPRAVVPPRRRRRRKSPGASSD